MNNMQGNVNYPNLTQMDYSNVPQVEPSFNNSNLYSLNEKKNSELLDPYQGFIRGNSFNQLYDKYKTHSFTRCINKQEYELIQAGECAG